jgi:5,5'-dehydrodivanillate O-demethylase
VLGEDLVLYRDGMGKLGLLGITCSHRLASLEFGYIEQCGLRCRYHGWLYDENGSVLEQPSEEAEGSFSEKIHHKAYPVKELGGLILAYLGPGNPPPLPQFDVLVKRGLRKASRVSYPVNYLQVVENAMDPWHTVYTHQSVRYWFRKSPGEVTFGKEVNSQFAGVYSRTTRPGLDGKSTYLRVVYAIVPSIIKISLHRQDLPFEQVDFGVPAIQLLGWRVPVDSTHTDNYLIAYGPEGTEKDFERISSPLLGGYEWPLKRDAEGRYIVNTVSSEDAAVITSQGGVPQRQHEHLGRSDRGIILFRNLLREGIEAIQKGEVPAGVVTEANADKIIDLPTEDALLIAK